MRQNLKASFMVIALTSFVFIGRSAIEPASAQRVSTRQGAPNSSETLRPEWAIPYGREFWRRKGEPSAAQRAVQDSPVTVSPEFDLDDIIDRVSHAITANEIAGAPPEVRAKTYSAVFDTMGVHVSPHRPRWNEPGSASVQSTLRPTSLRRFRS